MTQEEKQETTDLLDLNQSNPQKSEPDMTEKNEQRDKDDVNLLQDEV